MTRRDAIREVREGSYEELLTDYVESLVNRIFDSRDKLKDNELDKVFEDGAIAGVAAVALECNKRIISTNKTGSTVTYEANYQQGYVDALGELLEWMEYDMEDKK